MSAFVPENPQANELSPQLQLRDVWAGPETYAEDYYSAGNFNLGLEQDTRPDRLGSELLDAGHEIISVDDDDEMEEVPAASLSRTALQDALGQASRPPQMPLVEPVGHLFSGTFTGALGDVEGVIEPSRDVLDGRAASDTELMETDFDLEYPELSGSDSVTEVAVPLEGIPCSVGEAPAAVALRESEERSPEEPVPPGGEFDTQDIAESEGDRAELNMWEEEDNGNVGEAEPLPATDGGESVTVYNSCSPDTLCCSKSCRGKSSYRLGRFRKSGCWPAC